MAHAHYRPVRVGDRQNVEVVVVDEVRVGRVGDQLRDDPGEAGRADPLPSVDAALQEDGRLGDRLGRAWEGGRIRISN